MALRRRFVGGCLAIAAMGFLAGSGVQAVTVTVTPGTTGQTFEGIGAFASMPRLYRPAGAFYSNRPGSYELDKYVTGMGASCARFELLPDPYPTQGTAPNWSVISGDLNTMKELHKRGCDRFLLCVWSPPGWMKASGRTIGDNVSAGVSARGQNYLLPANYDAFATYMAQYCKTVKDSVGIEPYAVSPQNEPNFVEPYNSCVYSDGELSQLIALLGSKLQAQGLTTKIVAPEDVGQFGNFPTATANTAVWAAAVHGNYTSGAVSGKKLWMTEWDDANGTLVGNATILVNAFAGAYSFWTRFSYDNNCGTYTTDSKGVAVAFVPGIHYYPNKHIGSFIKPGAVRIGCDGGGLPACAYKNPDNTYAVVLVNSGSATTINVSGVSGTWQVYQSSANKNCQLTGTSSTGTGISIDAASVVSLTTGSPIPVLPADTIANSIAAPPHDHTIGLMNAYGDDILQLWLNGVQITNLNPNVVQRVVSVKAGENIVACYVKNVSWGGGLLASMLLPGPNGTEDTLRTDSTWKVTYKNPTADPNWNSLTYDDSQWSFANDAGPADGWPGFASWGGMAVNMYYEKARWILGASKTFFRKNYTSSTAKSVQLGIRGNGFTYKIYVNGTQIGTGTEFANCTDNCLSVPVKWFTGNFIAGDNCVALEIADAATTGNGVLCKFQFNPTSGYGTVSSPVGLDTTWKCSSTNPAGWNTASFNDAGWANPDTINAYDPNAQKISFVYPGRFWFRKKFTSAQATQLLSGLQRLASRDAVVSIKYFTLQGRELKSGMHIDAQPKTMLLKRTKYLSGRVEETRVMKMR